MGSLAPHPGPGGPKPFSLTGLFILSYIGMKVLLLLPLLLLLGVPFCTGWMRPRQGGMVRFGRSGDTLGDRLKDGVDDRDHDAEDEYEDYQEQVDRMLRTIMEKRIPPLLRTGKRNVASLLASKRAGNSFLRSRGFGK